MLIEHKRCEPHVASISVKREWLDKVTAGARRQMKYPALLLHFEGAAKHEEEWLCLPMSLATRILGMLKDEK